MRPTGDINKYNPFDMTNLLEKEVVSDPFPSFMDVALLDLEAAVILCKDQHHVHSLFYLEQSFEKSLKAFFYFYMSYFEQNNGDDIDKKVANFSHNNTEALMHLLRQFVEKYEKFAADIGISERSLIDKGKQFLLEFKDFEISKELLVQNYPHVLSKLFIARKMVMQREGDIHSSIDEMRKIAQQTKNEKARQTVLLTIQLYRIHFLVSLALMLSIAFKSMNEITRYPLKEFDFANTFILNQPTMREILPTLVLLVKEIINSIYEARNPEKKHKWISQL